MKTNHESKLNLKPVRYIVITDSTAKSSRRLRSLLKLTSYYCLVDCFKKSSELATTEIFYTPDCAIVEIRSLYSLFSINKKIQDLKEAIPGIKPVLFYSTLCRYPLLEQKFNGYDRFYAHEEEHIQLQCLEAALQDNNSSQNTHT